MNEIQTAPIDFAKRLYVYSFQDMRPINKSDMKNIVRQTYPKVADAEMLRFANEAYNEFQQLLNTKFIESEEADFLRRARAMMEAKE